MPIKIGTQSIGNVKLGNTQIAKVMLGTQLIWENAMRPQVLVNTSVSWKHDLSGLQPHDTVHTLSYNINLSNKANTLVLREHGTLAGIYCDNTARTHLWILFDNVRVSDKITLPSRGTWGETGVGSEGFDLVATLNNVPKGNHNVTFYFTTASQYEGDYNNGMYVHCNGDWGSSPTSIYIAVQ